MARGRKRGSKNINIRSKIDKLDQEIEEVRAKADSHIKKASRTTKNRTSQGKTPYLYLQTHIINFAKCLFELYFIISIPDNTCENYRNK